MTSRYWTLLETRYLDYPSISVSLMFPLFAKKSVSDAVAQYLQDETSADASALGVPLMYYYAIIVTTYVGGRCQIRIESNYYKWKSLSSYYTCDPRLHTTPRRKEPGEIEYNCRCLVSPLPTSFMYETTARMYITPRRKTRCCKKTAATSRSAHHVVRPCTFRALP